MPFHRKETEKSPVRDLERAGIRATCVCGSARGLRPSFTRQGPVSTVGTASASPAPSRIQVPQPPAGPFWACSICTGAKASGGCLDPYPVRQGWLPRLIPLARSYGLGGIAPLCGLGHPPQGRVLGGVHPGCQQDHQGRRAGRGIGFGGAFESATPALDPSSSLRVQSYLWGLGRAGTHCFDWTHSPETG